MTSLWNVNDEATKDLMIRFVSSYSSGLRDRADRRRSWRTGSRSTSAFEPNAPKGVEFDLQGAMLATRDEHSDPALWAGFVMFGLPTKQ